MKEPKAYAVHLKDNVTDSNGRNHYAWKVLEIFKSLLFIIYPQYLSSDKFLQTLLYLNGR